MAATYRTAANQTVKVQRSPLGSTWWCDGCGTTDAVLRHATAKELANKHAATCRATR